MWRKFHPGDIVIWRDGTLGVLVKPYGVYYGSDDRWMIEFAGPAPSDYSVTYGVCYTNLFNGCHTKEILSVKEGYASKTEGRSG